MKRLVFLLILSFKGLGSEVPRGLQYWLGVLVAEHFIPANGYETLLSLCHERQDKRKGIGWDDIWPRAANSG